MISYLLDTTQVLALVCSKVSEYMRDNQQSSDRVCSRTGGYLPFVLEIPSYGVTSGRMDEELLRISVGVTNAYNASLIPSDKNDYFLYGGLTGQVQVGRTGMSYRTEHEQFSHLS